MKTKVVALLLTLIAGAATAGQSSPPPGKVYYDVCDVELHDAYGNVAPDDRHTVTKDKANRLAEQSTRPTPIPSHKEVADAQD